MPVRRRLLTYRTPNAVLVVLATVLATQPAVAHAILVASHPPMGGNVPAGRVAFDLHYNSRIDRGRSRLTLMRPDGSQSVLPIDRAGAPDELDAIATLTQGRYTLRWQVLAIDGHITRGDLPFSVADH